MEVEQRREMWGHSECTSSLKGMTVSAEIHNPRLGQDKRAAKAKDLKYIATPLKLLVQHADHR